jgi:hypothetical protein
VSALLLEGGIEIDEDKAVVVRGALQGTTKPRQLGTRRKMARERSTFMLV